MTEEIIQSVRMQRYREGKAYFAIGSCYGGHSRFQISVLAPEFFSLFAIAEIPAEKKKVQAVKERIKTCLSNQSPWTIGNIAVRIDPEDIQYQKLFDELYIVMIKNSSRMYVSDGGESVKAILQMNEELKPMSFPVEFIFRNTSYEAVSWAENNFDLPRNN